MLQHTNLAHLFDRSRGGDVPLQGVEALVDRLHPVPLPRVPLDRLQVLLGFDHVPVDRVDRHQLAPGAHHNQGARSKYERERQRTTFPAAGQSVTVEVHQVTRTYI